MSATGVRAANRALGPAGLVVVWGPPSYGPRSRAFGDALGMPVVFLSATRRRGRGAAAFKYVVQFVWTLGVLARRRPRVVLVQSPPSFAAMAVWLASAVRRRPFVIDAHTDAMVSPYWTRPRWLIRHLRRAAAATVVTNDRHAATIRADGGRAVVIADVPQRRHATDPTPAEGFAVMVVCTYAPDEPVDQVLAAAALLPDVTFHLTGDRGRFRRALPPAPPNVRFTGFLPEDAYRNLMAGAGAVLCLTTRPDTMQGGACEALWAGRPIVTSDQPLLRAYFDRGTEHVAPTAQAIAAGVAAIAAEPAGYERAITELQTVRRRDWDEAIAALGALVEPQPRAAREDATRPSTSAT